jgi:disulfide bond formation protein DsbB
MAAVDFPSRFASLQKNWQQSWPLLALGASLGMLAAAHAFEKFGGLAPCALCLHQREAYWAAASIAALAVFATRFATDNLTRTAFAMLLTCAFGAGAVIAGFHMGVEFKWWPGLPECAGGGPLTVSNDILGTLSKSMDVPACDKVAWSFLGLSMAGWNMLISLGLAGLSLFSAFHKSPAQGIQNGQ